MNSERHLTPFEKLARRRAVVRARRLKSRVVRMRFAGMGRLARRRTSMRALLDGIAWEAFANDEEALAFAEEMADEALATAPPWEGGC